MLRSERMTSISLYIKGKNMHKTIEKLGESELLEFKNIREDKGKFENVCTKDVEKLEQRLQSMNNEIEISDEVHLCDFGEVESKINLQYTQMNQYRNKMKIIGGKREEMEQKMKVVEEFESFIDKYGKGKKQEFYFCCSVVERDKKFIIEEFINNSMYNNCYIEFSDVDLEYGNSLKSVMIVYIYGEEAYKKVNGIISSLGGVFYEREEILESFGTNLVKEEFKNIEEEFCKVENEYKSCLEDIGNNYKSWKIVFSKERKIYDTINCLKCTEPGIMCENIYKMQNISYTGEAWVKTSDLNNLENFISWGETKFYFEENEIQEEEIVPTAIKTNKYTEAFQNLTNVFGIPKYREINPGVFMIFTFPFMFGAMFGDIFHGIILLSVASLMIRNYERLNHNCGVLQVLLEGRFVILFCSLASIWFGFLYSDFGAIPFRVFKEGYANGKVYPFGIDPIWHHASNSMLFINNVKMKLSLIIGFIHMELGSYISIANCIYNEDKIELFCVALPQCIAFTLFLGYLVFLCFFKWLVTKNHPGLVNVLIGMYTNPLNIPDPMYRGQVFVQISIVLIILICVLWMFFAKPVYKIYKKEVKDGQMLDLWINAGIHTIEFMLGLISNTSSYLRLWAVSLAHVQLTAVMHQFTIGQISIFRKIIFLPFYALATIIILIGLEGLSSCLHALRLNWIEFFSKFYKGNGEMFKPLSFNLGYEEIHES